MGVPGFFLWLWKTYKARNFVFTKNNIPDIDKININNIDYFLLDMNCMIHPICFETLKELNIDDKLDINKLENKMISNVINYLEKTIILAAPKKGIFLAIDGVAPVAKMKQQRLRRYKSISDKELFDNIKKKHKKHIPYFWSNSAITPGTNFMNKLTVQLSNWAKDFCKNNPLNHNIEIIFSPGNVPGEGEHKLLQFIRNNKTIYNYVVYGLDADLIFLMLSTGLNTIYLMREGNNMENKGSDIMNFVSLMTMKQCIIDSINNIINNNNIIINNNNIIDDFIFICYLMGNDFLPHIPALDIYNHAIDTLLETYVDTFISTNNYIINRNNSITINNDTFNMFLIKLASIEEQTIIESFGKKKKKFHCQSTDPYDIEMHKIDNLMFKINDPIMLGCGSMLDWKNRFYDYHYKVTPDEINEFSQNMVNHYMIGLKWVTLYYFDKCPSWDWYYPFDHAPFLNEMIINIYDFNKVIFILSKPLSPFEQLLTVLPKESNYLLPIELRRIMTNINSSAAHLYPDKYEFDMIGKKKFWMCHPILPNMEINLIRKIFEKYYIKLSENDKNINEIKSDLIF